MSSHQFDTTVVVASVIYILYMKSLSFLRFPQTPTYPLFLKGISNFTYAFSISTRFLRNTTRI